MNTTLLPVTQPKKTGISLRDFLESVAPGKKNEISGLVSNGAIELPNITLHCETCGGIRIYASLIPRVSANSTNSRHFITYQCRNCKARYKTFALFFSLDDSGALKYGEEPSFGPPIPTRASKLIGSDRELFFKGRRCELQGLGVGAFTYYRRVLEDQRNRIFDEILRVLKVMDANNPVIPEIEAAKNEKRFNDSIDVIKHGLPASLLINGENPLHLLYSALSKGVHSMSDEECLELATAVRAVLFEFSERLAEALKDDAEIASAVNLLRKVKQ